MTCQVPERKAGGGRVKVGGGGVGEEREGGRIVISGEGMVGGGVANGREKKEGLD